MISLGLMLASLKRSRPPFLNRHDRVWSQVTLQARGRFSSSSKRRVGNNRESLFRAHFQQRQSLLTTHRWKIIQRLLQTGSFIQISNERTNRHADSGEARRSTQALRVNPDNLIRVHEVRIISCRPDSSFAWPRLMRALEPCALPATPPPPASATPDRVR